MWLIVESLRLSSVARNGDQSPRVSGLVTAWVFLVLCLVTSGGAFLRGAAEEVYAAIVRSGPPTAAEIAYTPQELEAEVDRIATESIHVFSAEMPTGEDYHVWEEYCQTSNMRRGVSYLGIIYIPFAGGEGEFRAPATAGLEGLGLTVTTPPSGLNYAGTPTVSATGGVMEEIDFIEHLDRGKVSLGFETVCVLHED